MTNQLVRIGQLLVDLGRDLPTEVDSRDLEDVQMEFVRIKSHLLEVWSRKPPELGYLLAFHAAEAGRLFYGIRPVDLGKDEDLDLRRDFSEVELFRIGVYSVIAEGLLGVMEHVELLGKGKNIELRLG